jgi:phage baseplate assembly protein V
MNAYLRGLAVRTANLVSRAVVALVDDSSKLQVLQVEVGEGEVREAERVQEYGFTSVPLEGAEGVVVFVGGRRDHGLVVATDDRRHRPTGLQTGEVAVYTDEGDQVIIRRGGTIEVTAATKVVVDAPVVELAGNADALALASKVAAELTVLKNAINAAPVVPGDGGAAFKAALVAALAAWPTSVASAKVKAE